MTTLYIGADPEMFIKSRATGLPVSAHDIVPGTKAVPYRIHPNVQVQADGTAVEFNINPIVYDGQRTLENAASDFDSRIYWAIEDIKYLYLEGRNLRINETEVVQYASDYFQALPESAKELGCEPDYNAYLGRMNILNIPKDKPTMRTAAGHIHIGWIPPERHINNIYNKEHINDCRIIIANLDNMLRYTQPPRERDSIRRQLYGDYGAFRPKKYGVEWRTPSNFWLWHANNRYRMFKNVVRCTLYTFEHGLFKNVKLPDNHNAYERFV